MDQIETTFTCLCYHFNKNNFDSFAQIVSTSPKYYHHYRLENYIQYYVYFLKTASEKPFKKIPEYAEYNIKFLLCFFSSNFYKTIILLIGSDSNALYKKEHDYYLSLVLKKIIDCYKTKTDDIVFYLWKCLGTLSFLSSYPFQKNEYDSATYTIYETILSLTDLVQTAIKMSPLSYSIHIYVSHVYYSEHIFELFTYIFFCDCLPLIINQSRCNFHPRLVYNIDINKQLSLCTFNRVNKMMDQTVIIKLCSDHASNILNNIKLDKYLKFKVAAYRSCEGYNCLNQTSFSDAKEWYNRESEVFNFVIRLYAIPALQNKVQIDKCLDLLMFFGPIDIQFKLMTFIRVYKVILNNYIKRLKYKIMPIYESFNPIYNRLAVALTEPNINTL
ncbi:hypothetical protein nvc1_010 [Namao virus]|nr:hypothetical protein nvc1_010 [Namao virus]